MSNLKLTTSRAVFFSAFAVLAILFTCFTATPAHAMTSTDLRFEVDEINKHIDSLQTGLNEARKLQADATAEYDEAVALRDEAQRNIEETSARLDELQDKLSAFAVSMYKSDGANTFLGVLLQTSSFDEFMVNLDRCVIISKCGSDLLEQEREVRAQLEESRAAYEEQSQRAEQKLEAAKASAAQIEGTRNALQEEVGKLNAEAARLQKEEEEKAKQNPGQPAAQPSAEQRAATESEIKEKVAALAAAAASANAEAGAASHMGTGYFANPCPGASESSGFGYRDFDHSFHKGLDMAAPEGTPFYAGESGTVLYATNDGGYNGGAGNWVVISHGNGIVTKYMHALTTFVKPGDHVERGQNIGLVGSTGKSTGAHLHFQVEFGDVAVNPLNYI